MKKSLLLVFLFTSILSFSQTVRFEGTVQDNAKAPLEMANVMAMNQATKAMDAYAITNDKGKFLVKINPRGKAANSDHYFFTEKGVPAFFMYTQGGISAYHDVFDQPETLPFTVYENLFKLFVGFNQSLMN